MFIVFCSEISCMGTKFENNSQGMIDMGNYINECLNLHPKATIKVMRWQ